MRDDGDAAAIPGARGARPVSTPRGHSRPRRVATVALVVCFLVFFATAAVAMFSPRSFALDLVMEVTGGAAILLTGAHYPRKTPPAQEHSVHR